MNPINNAIYLRRRNKICLPRTVSESVLPLNYVASVLKNIEPLGFTFAEPLIQACRLLSLEQLTALYQVLVTDLQRAKGAHRQHRPMYPNFPAQVMAMSEGELYINAILHYITEGQYRPATVADKRPLLPADMELEVIALGTREEFERLFGQIAGSNTSLSAQDNEDLAWFVEAYGSDITPMLPDAIPQKETMAYVVGLLIRHIANAAALASRYCRTATDVLRLAVAMSGGDVSLAAATRFRSFKRAERDLLLSLLDRQTNAVEDMRRWQGRWVRLGERLHPGEYARKYPQAAEAFRLIRNDVPVTTFNGQVEAALAHRKTQRAVALLATRAGDFARRLDHLLRRDPYAHEDVVEAFRDAADRVSTPVLLQVMHHFRQRNPIQTKAGDETMDWLFQAMHQLRGRNPVAPIRVFFPKGNLAKAYAVTDVLPDLPESVCARVASVCEAALIARFRALPPLGRVYVDPALSRYLVPFGGRSASKSLRTITRGSSLPLPPRCKVLRFFVWWKNGQERTDIDLSAAMFDVEFNFRDIVSYYNLKGYGGCHSGDIVNAPQGASEFIDITLDRVREKGIRYVVMTLTSYTQQPYRDLPECFAGWMARDRPNSGAIYEPKTVQDRLDITADTRIAIPLIIDVGASEVIWCDMALRRNPRWQNNVHRNLNGINLTLQALSHLNKPNLYELFALHAAARGELVANRETAETVFSVDSGLPFRQEEIASGYLG